MPPQPKASLMISKPMIESNRKLTNKTPNSSVPHNSYCES